MNDVENIGKLVGNSWNIFVATENTDNNVFLQQEKGKLMENWWKVNHEFAE